MTFPEFCALLAEYCKHILSIQKQEYEREYDAQCFNHLYSEGIEVGR